MAAASTAHKRLFVRHLLEAAQSGSTTIIALLKSYTTSRITETASGKVIVAHTGNGHSAQYQIPDDWSPEDAIELLSDIRDRYVEAKEKLEDVDDISDPTDTQIHNEMLDKLPRGARRSPRSDFTYLRIGNELEED